MLASLGKELPKTGIISYIFSINVGIGNKAMLKLFGNIGIAEVTYHEIRFTGLFIQNYMMFLLRTEISVNKCLRNSVAWRITV